MRISKKEPEIPILSVPVEIEPDFKPNYDLMTNIPGVESDLCMNSFDSDSDALQNPHTFFLLLKKGLVSSIGHLQTHLKFFLAILYFFFFSTSMKSVFCINSKQIF